MPKRSFLLLSILVAFASLASAQNIFTEGLKGNIPTVRFSFDNPGLKPSAYQITIDATGDAEYFSPEEGTNDGTGTRRKFQVTKQTRDRIFELTASLRQFRGDYEFRKHKVAFSGHKTLTYTEGAEEYSTKFNWSENKDITELGALFQGIATTVQSEARLLYLRKYDKLGLDEQLKAMESQAKSGWLKEIGVISKVLSEIKDDRAVMRMARDRAERLLHQAGN